MSKIKGLVCKECKKEYPAEAIHVCEFCFGPLEVAYNYEHIQTKISKEKIMNGPLSLWRYEDLLPIESAPTVGLHTGFTPMIHAKNLGKKLGLDHLYIKNDSVNAPTLSFKDRVVAVALTRAKELGFDTVACASTGNLANSVSANAAQAGFKCFVFIPADLEAGKILGNLVYNPNVVAVEGNYDDVNRLCSEIAGNTPGPLSTSTSVRIIRKVQKLWPMKRPRPWAGKPPSTSSSPLLRVHCSQKFIKVFMNLSDSD